MPHRISVSFRSSSAPSAPTKRYQPPPKPLVSKSRTTSEVKGEGEGVNRAVEVKGEGEGVNSAVGDAGGENAGDGVRVEAKNAGDGVKIPGASPGSPGAD